MDQSQETAENAAGETTTTPTQDVADSANTHAEPMAMGGAYEAADRFNQSLMNWQPSITPVDDEIAEGKEGSEARIRDVRRNSARVDHGVRVNQDSIVGANYALSAKPLGRALGPEFDDDWSAAFQEEVEMKFSLWASSSEGYCDAQGAMTFTDMVRLVTGLSVVSSEVLASVEWLGTRGRPYGTAIQMIDIDRLSTPVGKPESARLRNGIKRDSFGRAVGYYIRETHPGDWKSVDKMFSWKLVPSHKPWGRRNIIHIIDPLRPDQTRGISSMVAALKSMRMLSRYDDVALQNAALQATYAMSIESENPADAIYALMGQEGMSQEDAAQAAQSATASYLEGLGSYVQKTGRLSVDGVKIPHLYPGTKLNAHPLSKSTAPGSDLEKSILRSIAASLGISYEQLSLNFSENSYAGIRAAIGETQKHLAARKRAFADRFASAVYRAWLEEAIVSGHISTIPPQYRNVAWIHAGSNLDALAHAEWIGASQPVIDPLKEAKAIEVLLSLGLTTREQEAARRGHDWREIDRQRAREEKNARTLGLSYATSTTIDPEEFEDDETSD